MAMGSLCFILALICGSVHSQFEESFVRGLDAFQGAVSLQYRDTVGEMIIVTVGDGIFLQDISSNTLELAIGTIELGDFAFIDEDEDRAFVIDTIDASLAFTDLRNNMLVYLMRHCVHSKS